MALTAQQAAARWASQYAAAGDKMKQGAESVTVNPMEQAANAKDAWLAGVQKAASEDKFATGLRSAGGLNEWRTAYITKGIPAAQQAVNLGKKKVERVMQTLIPYTQNVKETIAQMPSGSLAASKARMNAAFDLMSQYRKPT